MKKSDGFWEGELTVWSDFPCKGCESRVAGCHSTCEKYLAAKKMHEEKKETIRKTKKKLNEMSAYEIERGMRMRRK